MPLPPNPPKAPHPYTALWKKPFCWIEYLLEYVLYCSKRLAIFELAEYIAKAGILVSLIFSLVSYARLAIAQRDDLLVRQRQQIVDNYSLLVNGEEVQPIAIRQLALRELYAAKDRFEKVGLVPLDFRSLNLQWLDIAALDEGHEKLRNSRFEFSDLSGATLGAGDYRKAVFNHATLINATIEGDDVNMRGALFHHAKLSGASLQGVHLENAELINTEFYQLTGTGFLTADLSGAYLNRATCHDAKLRGVRLIRADLSNADFERCIFSRTNRLPDGTWLQAATFLEAKLDGTNFQHADLTGVDFREIKGRVMNGVDLRNAKLHDVDLRGVDLRGIKSRSLKGADLKSAKLKGTDLRGIDLRRALNLEKEQLTEAVIEGAKLP